MDRVDNPTCVCHVIILSLPPRACNKSSTDGQPSWPAEISQCFSGSKLWTLAKNKILAAPVSGGDSCRGAFPRTVSTELALGTDSLTPIPAQTFRALQRAQGW